MLNSFQLPIAETAIEQAHMDGSRRALEADEFPFEAISDVAEKESWRKEINRPIYHVHKWWAQRLGSVFRALIIGALSPERSDVIKRFYQPMRFEDAVVYDPFMGSGTTVGEAIKLGCRAIGRDINSVSYFLVRNALEKHSREAVEEAFARLAREVRPEIAQYYRARLPNGEDATALYYFWTKSLPCPTCNSDVDLMSSRIFARHAYPSKYPNSKALCPGCGHINIVRYDAGSAECEKCSLQFNPQIGEVKGRKAQCPCCNSEFSVAETANAQGTPPRHRMYAKMVLKNDGSKVYLPIDQFDLDLYALAEKKLGEEHGLFPVVEIKPGYNTNQAINYGYRYWHQMFNSRQLLCLGLLARSIKKIPNQEVRDALACLFSGTLEFNNMFASFKGEGTGAVRHMFSHHILKPERTPLEANVWGTSKSSGAFSSLYKSRLLRALDYADNPFELDPEGNKFFGLSDPLGAERADTFEAFSRGTRLYISCGDSAETDISSESVDAIITDPPFFDNVNYSQLADFFHVWQRHILDDQGRDTTRSDREVQHQEAAEFSSRLGGVLRECHRVLKREGILAFSYHHSREEGWSSVADALAAANFVVTAAFPVKAEMSGASPKNQAKEPIDLDIIIVCRKAEAVQRKVSTKEDARSHARSQVNRLRLAGRKLSRNDIAVILMGQLLKASSQTGNSFSQFANSDTKEMIDDLYSSNPSDES